MTRSTQKAESPTDLPKRSWKEIAKRVARQVPRDELTDRAAALTYYGVQSIFPAVLVLVSVVGLLGRSAAQSLVSNLGQIAPGSVGAFLKTVITNAQSQKTAAGVLGIVGIVLAIWAASGYIAAFMRSSNAIYAMPEGRPLWKSTAIRLGITVFTGVALVAGMVIVIATGSVAQQIGKALGLGHAAVTAWEIAKWPVLLLLFVLILAVLYSAAPNVEHASFRWISPGAALTVVAWLVVSGLFALYVANFGSYNKTYGALAGVIVFLVWLWLSNLAILLGVEVDAELERERAIREGLAEDAEPYAIAKDTRKLDDEQTAQAEHVERVRNRAVTPAATGGRHGADSRDSHQSG